MSHIHFASIQMLHLLWLVPGIILLYVYAAYRRRAALLLFAEAGILDKINTSINLKKRFWKSTLFVLAIVCIILALVRPGWNPKAKKLERKGRDIVFVLDVSKSMLAEDLVPNRLERAKLAILDCIERLQGDRIGLVAFAGTAVVKCPLTLDYGFFRLMLKNISPQSVLRGGTMIGDAIRKVLDEIFDDRIKRYKDIILITDGEDHDSFPVEAAKEAGQRGIRIIAIGIGDPKQGKRIPITDEQGNKTFLKYKGQEVWSKLDKDTLLKMVNATPGGKYFGVETGTIDLGDVYMKVIAKAEKKRLESKTIKRYEEKFQLFLGLAFVLLIIESMMSERTRKA